MEIKFKVLGAIKSKQRPFITSVNGKPRGITPYDTLCYENLVREQFWEQCGEFSFKDKPISIKATAYFTPPKNVQEQMEYMKGKGNEVENRVICIGTKDFDNIYKIICDSLNKIAYNDDKQIWNDMGFQKFYTLEQERLEITLTDEKSSEYVDTNELKEMYVAMKNTDKILERIERLNKKPKLTKSERELLNELYSKLINK